MPDVLQSIPAVVLSKLDSLAAEYARTEHDLNDPLITADHRRVREVSIKRASLEPVVRDYAEFRRLAAEAADLRAMAESKDGGGTERALVEMAAAELPEVESRARAVIERVKSALVNADDRRVGSVILEVRAGTGGDEAALWARDIFEMYQRLASRRGWRFEALDLTAEGNAGGFRHAMASVVGEGVWSELLFEAGVHSVKRVPATETQGRIHTSTATVAVLPEPEEVDVKIDWSADVREDVTTAQGPGGQNVNKVATAVKLLHLATGIEVRMQESKSQQQNREKARRLLMARLYELERSKKHAERSAARNSQIGAGERSEKIRTYRYKEGIIADERLPGQYALRDVLAGDMDSLLGDLMEQETQRRLAAL